MEAIFLVCGAGGPQLKRNPLGCTITGLRPPAHDRPAQWVPKERRVYLVRCQSKAQQHAGPRPELRIRVVGAAGAEVLGYTSGRVQPNMRLKLAAPGLGRIPFVPHRTSCSSVNSAAPLSLRAAA